MLFLQDIFITLLVLSPLIVIHELGHFLLAKKNGVRVERFSLGFGAALWKIKKAHTEYCVGSIPLGGYIKMAGDSLEDCKGRPYEYYSQPPGKRFQIIFFGPLFNYILGFMLLWTLFFTGYPASTTKIGALKEGFGAQKAGLQVGDKIIAIDGKKIVLFEDLQKIISRENTADTVTVTYLRGNEERSTPVQIRESSIDDSLGQKKSVPLIGVSPGDEEIVLRFGFLESFGRAFSRCVDITVLTYKGLWYMVTRRISVRESVTGPLGIVDIISHARSLGLRALLSLAAILSINLGIFNLLPLPILDGGHIILLAVEKIRRRPLTAKAEEVITNIGFSMMMFLVVFVTYNDIVRMHGNKIAGFFK